MSPAPARPAPRVRADVSHLLQSQNPLVAGPLDSPAHHVRAALDTRLRALVAHDPGTRTGADIEDLHQMRVSVRRMRATLRAARPLLDAQWADSLRAELGWLGRALGPVRDLDVMLLRLRGEIATLPDGERAAGEVLVAELERERAAARADMLVALDAPRYTALLERIADAVRLPLPTPSAMQPQPALIDLVRTEARKLARAVKAAGEDPPDETLHALRILGKRVRYTGELVETALRGTPTGRQVKLLLAATAELQEVLGDHQDACVADLRIRELLDRLGTAALDEAGGEGGEIDAFVVFVAGRLVERERACAETLRTQWWDAWVQVRDRAATLG
ncbi:CHAD domain-containing protein [Pseudonocardia sp. D17]|uniref:CHAD domain-containing protein n=1 Tax=Pseudonocardia sp. D17 TaxID=882661 RepID=UPI002B3D47F0|nr:CHAD domain-containing protein [Pseudonocardia sp. D17]